ncbi:hypothetical protein HWV62_10331 [Athelia sp. TMB]|nr:hypothetical protein HWV62_10331 [Athelia sp. TMB]
MSQVPCEVYIQQLLPKKYGFPMYYPAPPSSFPLVLRKRGISIGDVGIIRPDGSFQFVFNIFAPCPRATGPNNIWQNEEPPINYFGVPNGFEPLPWNPAFEECDEDKHNKGSELMSEGVTKHDVNASIDTNMGDGSTTVPAISVSYTVSSTTTETAVLAMPDGARGEKYRNTQSIQDYTEKNARLWYNFINGEQGLQAPNGSVYVVTACVKATAWGIATAATRDSSHSASFKFTAVKGVGVGAGYSCSWSTSSGTVSRNSTESNLGPGIRQPHNQCLFIQGMKVMIRDGPSKMIKGSVKVESTEELTKPKDLLRFGKTFPGAGSGYSGGSSHLSSPSRHSSGEQDEQAETEMGDDDWSDVLELDSNSGAYHPLDTINRYLLDNTEADVAVAHESDWWTLSPGPTLASEEEILRRIPDYYKPVVKSLAASLELISDAFPDAQNEHGSAMIADKASGNQASHPIFLFADMSSSPQTESGSASKTRRENGPRTSAFGEGNNETSEKYEAAGIMTSIAIDEMMEEPPSDVKPKSTGAQTLRSPAIEPSKDPEDATYGGSSGGSSSYRPSYGNSSGGSSSYRSCSLDGYLQNSFLMSSSRNEANKGIAVTVDSYLPSNLDGQIRLKPDAPSEGTCGGYGDVLIGNYRREDEAMQTVAIKILRPRVYKPDGKGYVRKDKGLRREIRLWLPFHHSNIVQLLGLTIDFDQLDPFFPTKPVFPGMVSPSMENGNINAYLMKNDLRLVDLLKLSCDVAAGFEYLHAKYVIHGDLTSANVLIDASGLACLTDFGLSSLKAGFQKNTSHSTANIGGAIHWGALELLPPFDWVATETWTPIPTTACDIFSYGQIVLQVFSRKLSYRETKNADLLAMHLDMRNEPWRPSAPSSLRLIDEYWVVAKKLSEEDPKFEKRLSAQQLHSLLSCLQVNALTMPPLVFSHQRPDKISPMRLSDNVNPPPSLVRILVYHFSFATSANTHFPPQ